MTVISNYCKTNTEMHKYVASSEPVQDVPGP